MAASSPSSPLLEVRRLSTHFVTEEGVFRAVEDLSFQLMKGESMGLVGESGCGKTTAMLSLLRLLPAAGRIVSGEVLLEGRDLMGMSESEMRAVRWHRFSMIFQGAMNAFNPVRTVGDQIAEALVVHGLATGSNAAGPRVSELLELVGIPGSREAQFPHQYSGGMRQRAMIAMALACSPQIVVADEPTTALDVMIQAQILELLERLQRELGLAVILVTHDLSVVAELCHRVLVMYGGVLAEYSSVDRIFNEPLHPYTRLLLSAFPDLSRPEGKLISIPGHPPRLNEIPPGCRFTARCPQAFARCHVETPAAREVRPGHWVACHLYGGGAADAAG
ncbi:MAG: dipeptide/oligopeptide/nickel ABC transporter ATP-binding protein [Chloroflexi bacterium RBG_13_66_10]|jgi:peptide/nickel transport system ATP-binding protein|nr:MAG: dipeptide/oligopeptide/nickel ABC transporter ATP-binding protein [Chloroflexi bacterium RBG_13_66_10]